jgi:hypothetical protein
MDLSPFWAWIFLARRPVARLSIRETWHKRCSLYVRISAEEAGKGRNVTLLVGIFLALSELLVFVSRFWVLGVVIALQKLLDGIS